MLLYNKFLMENPSLQKKLLKFIADYNDGKITVVDMNGRKVKSSTFKNGIAHKEYVTTWIEMGFIEQGKYTKDDVEENLRLLANDGKIKPILKDGEGYLNGQKEIFLTSEGYRSLSIFKRYPFYTWLGILAGIATIISAILQILNFLQW